MKPAKELTHGRDGFLSEPRALVLVVGVGEQQGVRANQGPVGEGEGHPCWSNPSAVLSRNATPSVFHQRHIGRVLRSSCNVGGRRAASSCGREPRPGRCPPLWPG